MTTTDDTAAATVRELAATLAASFETAHRGDDPEQPFDRLKDDAPEWCTDVVREAHGRDQDGAPAMLPDDYRYSFARAAADAIAEADDDDDLDELADQLEPDIYTAELTSWLGSHSYRPAYCDEAEAELGPTGGTIERLQAGQLQERREVFAAVLSELRARAD